MSVNPLNELKRRLEDDDTPLRKRLCLARNVVQSHHFPTAPKERIVADWVEYLTQENKLNSEELKNTLRWMTTVDLTNELKSKLIQIATEYIRKNPITNELVHSILQFIENDKVIPQLCLHVDEYLSIIIILLQHLYEHETNFPLSERMLNNMINYYKESKKKLEFIAKLLKGENLETLFSYLNTKCHDTVIKVCQLVLFPINKKSFFLSFLHTMIRKENINDLREQKNDNIQSVLKIMTAFFTFPNNRTAKNPSFLCDFITAFVNSFKSESQMVFAFYVMVVNTLNMSQSYLTPAMKIPTIIFEEDDDKTKRNIFLNMLEALIKSEIDVNVRFTDIVGEKISKVEIKKNFLSFLQAVMMGQLKLEGKVDKTTLQIIKCALKLDPSLIEQKIDQILPPIATMKKSKNSLEPYKEMLCSLLEILFKLSKGISFIDKILPNIKLHLETCNTEQFQLKQKLVECTSQDMECEKLKNKIITRYDIFPDECVEMYGRLSTDLMFRQNSELLVCLQRNFEENCLMMLEENFVSPSIIILAEVLSTILCTVFDNCKMADHTVPQPIAEDFWAKYKKFECEILKRFGECILKLSHNPTLVISFLKLCLSCSHLKLLNLRYSNVKMDIDQGDNGSDIFDFSVILSCINTEQWNTLVGRIADDESRLLLDKLLVVKTIAVKLLSQGNDETGTIRNTKTHLIKHISTNADILETNSYLAKALFTDLDKTQVKQLAKCLVKLYLNSVNTNLFKCDAIASNRSLLDALVLETAKNMTKCFQNINTLTKAMGKRDFVLTVFLKDLDIKDYFEQISFLDSQDEILSNCIEILKQLNIDQLNTNFQLIAIFVLLITKKCCHSKKLRRSVDHLLQNIFELSPTHPNLYEIFPIDYLFSFSDKTMLNLLTLKIKTSNHSLLIKSILETAVRKVKNDSEIVKNIVNLLLRNKTSKISSIDYFSDPLFQINCLILPIIAKHKKTITVSAYRSILAELQEKLHNNILESFKHIDFSKSDNLLPNENINNDESVAVSENTVAILNAMDAYSLTLCKYCETTDAAEIKKLNCLWSGLDFFIQNAIQTQKSVDSKPQHIESATQLLNVVLRYTKKLESHKIFQDKDKLFVEIWRSVKARLHMVFDHKLNDRTRRITDSCLEDIAVTLKFLCELCSVECFIKNCVDDLNVLTALKKPSTITKNEELTNSQITSHKTSKYLWAQYLKANIVGPKCVAMSKLMARKCKTLKFWIQQHYESIENDGNTKNIDFDDGTMNKDNIENDRTIINVDDVICDLLNVELEILADVIMAAKKISLDYKFLDSIFELLHLIHYIMGRQTMRQKCNISCTAFLKLFDGSVAVLNSLLVGREELLEDRWPCYMQCYRALISCLCERSASQIQMDRLTEEKYAERAHHIEKLTQSICKRKTHIARIAAYTTADICSWLERTAPSRMVRQHLENVVSSLIQTTDSTHAMAFLRRTLAGSAGQMTMTNLYTMYKRYHKYVGNA